MLPPELERILSSHSDIGDTLDDRVLTLLENANVDRAKEVLEDLVSKGDVRNPNAFIAAALTKFPRKRRRHNETEQLLEQHPDIYAQLDDNARRMLLDVIPSRAAEIIEELISGDHVRKPSAFVIKSLEKYPEKRGQRNPDAPPPKKRGKTGSAQAAPRKVGRMQAKAVAPQNHSRTNSKISTRLAGKPSSSIQQVAKRGLFHPEVLEALQAYPGLIESLDPKARNDLERVNPDRALEVIDELMCKGDRNPSAFISQALMHSSRLTRVPRDRLVAMQHNLMAYEMTQEPTSEVELFLSQYPHIDAALDDDALQQLQNADPGRAIELLEEVVAKGGVGNISAFVVKGLRAHPRSRRLEDSLALEMAEEPATELELFLSQYPHIEAALSDGALRDLQAADPRRAMELLEEVAEGNVTNVSAFVVKGLKIHPRVRRSAELELCLSQYPEIQASLDDRALNRLRAADPDRAIELIEEAAKKGDVKNYSGYLVKGLRAHPTAKRRQPTAQNNSGPYGLVHEPASEVELFLSQYPQIEAALDDRALAQLQAADPNRAMELLEEVAAKGDVVNVSAFVMKGLKSHPRARQRKESWSAPQHDSIAYDMAHEPTTDLELVLSQYPHIEAALDLDAIHQLQLADPDRAIKIIEDVAAKGDVINVSAFVVRGLKSAPLSRRRRDVPQEPTSDLEHVLCQYPEILAELDDGALRKLEDADPRIAVELIEEVVMQGDIIVNVSKFIVQSLKSRQPRGREGQRGAPHHGSSAVKGANLEQLELVLSKYPEIEAALDDRVFRQLEVADPDRAKKLIEEVAEKGDITNISAYVMKGLRSRPQRRDHAEDQNERFENLLAQHCSVAEQLDEEALHKLRFADPKRADDVLNELAAKADGIRNPSAFVRKALLLRQGSRREGREGEVHTPRRGRRR